MLKLTEENWEENFENLSKMKNVIIQAYRPDVGNLSGREDYQPYWAGRADDIGSIGLREALTMVVNPYISSDIEIPEPRYDHLLKATRRQATAKMKGA